MRRASLPHVSRSSRSWDCPRAPVPARTRSVREHWSSTGPAPLRSRTVPTAPMRVRELVRTACTAAELEYRETDHMVLRRGPYLIGVGLEGTPSGAAHELQGHFIDLFAPRNPIAKSFKLAPGQVGLLYDVDRVGETFPRVLASACKTLEPERTRDGGFRVPGPRSGTNRVAGLHRIESSPAPCKP